MFPIHRNTLLTVEFSMAGLFFDPIHIFSDQTQKNAPFDLIPSKNPLAKKTSAWYTGGILKKHLNSTMQDCILHVSGVGSHREMLFKQKYIS